MCRARSHMWRKSSLPSRQIQTLCCSRTMQLKQPDPVGTFVLCNEHICPLSLLLCTGSALLFYFVVLLHFAVLLFCCFALLKRIHHLWTLSHFKPYLIVFLQQDTKRTRSPTQCPTQNQSNENPQIAHIHSSYYQSLPPLPTMVYFFQACVPVSIKRLNFGLFRPFMAILSQIQALFGVVVPQN